MRKPLTTYRTLWISDLHLGTRGCRAEDLLTFLAATEAETLYLVGDVFDGWRLRQSWHWPRSHGEVVQRLFAKADQGTRVVYIPGNHDAFARDFAGRSFGGIEVAPEAQHTTRDGLRLGVLHGDAYDVALKGTQWLAKVGGGANHLLVRASHGVDRAGQRLGLPPWSLSATLKRRVKQATRVIERFEQGMVDEVRMQGLDGVVCGHIHQPGMKEIDGILYCNTGDWIEHCTAVVEHEDGRLELLAWEPEPRPRRRGRRITP